MSGAVKSGLIFGLIAMLLVAATAFIPIIGVLICGPLLAAILGGFAGYFGVRWGAATSGIGAGIGAGALTGVGVLIGIVAFFVIYLAILRSIPGADEAILEQLRQQNPELEIDPGALSTMISVAGPLAGLCIGMVELLIALAAGALGGYIATRNRQPAAAPPPPPMGPPPLSPL